MLNVASLRYRFLVAVVACHGAVIAGRNGNCGPVGPTIGNILPKELRHLLFAGLANLLERRIG
jgi:hypothetical protein